MGGGAPPPPPATQPCVRVRTRRCESVALVPIDQRRKSERFEVRIGESYGEGLGAGKVPGAETTAGGVASQPWPHAQLEQSRSATMRCFPLPPQSTPKS